MESKIYSAICNAMAEIGAIGKDSKNQQQGYKFRGIDAVYNALQPVLIKNHIFVSPEVLEQHREERQTSKGGNLIYSVLKVKFTFYAEDGSNVSATVIGEGMDSGDKASNKAMSVAFKYACFEVFCIPTDEMKDPDEDTPPENAPAPLEEKYIHAIRAEIERTGWKEPSLLSYASTKFGRNISDLSQLKMNEFAYMAKLLQSKEDNAARKGGA